MSLQRLGNPFVRALLRSPLHRTLSNSLLLITYTGRRTGRTFTIPVMYAEDGADLIVSVGNSAKKVWWRNLRDGAPVGVRLRGEELTGAGAVLVDGSELREKYLARFPRAAPSLAADPSPVFVRITDLKPLT